MNLIKSFLEDSKKNWTFVFMNIGFLKENDEYENRTMLLPNT